MSASPSNQANRDFMTATIAREASSLRTAPSGQLRPMVVRCGISLLLSCASIIAGCGPSKEYQRPFEPIRKKTDQPIRAANREREGNTLLREADELLVAERYDEAIERYQASIAKNPELGGAYYGIGVAQQRKGLREQALTSLQGAIDLNPYDTKALALYGTICQELGRHQEAITSLERATRAEPRNAPAYVALGRSYLAVDSSAEAERALLLAKKADPSLPSPMFYLGKLYLKNGRKEDASRELQRFIFLAEQNGVMVGEVNEARSLLR